MTHSTKVPSFIVQPPSPESVHVKLDGEDNEEDEVERGCGRESEREAEDCFRLSPRMPSALRLVLHNTMTIKQGLLLLSFAEQDIGCSSDFREHRFHHSSSETSMVT
jgi:hypothetical protein